MTTSLRITDKENKAGVLLVTVELGMVTWITTLSGLRLIRRAIHQRKIIIDKKIHTITNKGITKKLKEFEMQNSMIFHSGTKSICGCILLVKRWRMTLI